MRTEMYGLKCEQKIWAEVLKQKQGIGEPLATLY